MAGTPPLAKCGLFKNIVETLNNVGHHLAYRIVQACIVQTGGPGHLTVCRAHELAGDEDAASLDILLAKKRRSCDEHERIAWMKHRAKGEDFSKQQRGVDAETKVVGVGVCVQKMVVFRVATSSLVTATCVQSAWCYFLVLDLRRRASLSSSYVWRPLSYLMDVAILAPTFGRRALACEHSTENSAQSRRTTQAGSVDQTKVCMSFVIETFCRH